MAEYKYIKELLSTGTGTEGSLLIVKKIYDTIIEEVEKVLIPRTEAAFVIGPSNIPGSSIDIDLETFNTLNVRVIAEGASIPIDQQRYSSINIKPIKYGVGIRITREMLEDAKWNLLERNIKIAGRRLAENENNLVLLELDTAANTVSGGAAITIANITTAMQNLETNDFHPTTLAVGFEVLQDLRNIDTFVEANKVGNTQMLNTGFIGNIYGMNVIRFSANGQAAPSTTYQKYAYVWDKDQAYCIVEKRPVMVERFELPDNDMSAAVLTQRLAVKALRTSAISNITTT
jgi:HK97 family phage major capsid protein